jgi:uncharacterized protein YneF (UPF0154 family)
MLFSTTTEAMAGLGQVSTALFSDISGWLTLLIGIILGFWILETLIGTLRPPQPPLEKE